MIAKELYVTLIQGEEISGTTYFNLKKSVHVTQ